MPDPTIKHDTAVRRKSRDGWRVTSILFLIAILVATLLIAGFFQVEQARNQHSALLCFWRLGACILFEGDEVYTNPPITSPEWNTELSRDWVDQLTAPPPTEILFAGPRGGPPPVVDSDVPKLINALQLAPTVTSVQLDVTKITPAGLARLKATFPKVYFSEPRP
jgi:hypothetical protein